MPRRHTKISKEKFLEEFALGYSPYYIFKKYGYSGNANLYHWIKTDAKFKAKFKELKAKERPDVDRRVKKDHGRPPSTFILKPKKTPEEEDWRDRYFKHYREHRDRYRAASYAGKTILEIIKHLDDSHESYDNKFAVMWREQEVEEAFVIEDRAKQKAIHYGDLNAIKHLLPTLPVVGEKYRREARRSEGNVVVALFSVRNRENAIKEINGALENGRSLEGKGVDIPKPTASLLS